MNFFKRQIPVIGNECQETLKNKRVFIGGIGGLGTIVSESLLRSGLRELYIVDHDVVDETNIHRQILYDVEDIGKRKVEVAKKRLESIGFQAKIHAIDVKIKEGFQLPKVNVIVDCLDNPRSKVLLSKMAAEEKIPFVHGGVNGYFGQVLSLNGKALSDILSFPSEDGKNPILLPTVSLTASIQAMEVIKILCDKEGTLFDKIMFLDLLNYDFNVVDVENA